MHIVRRCLSSMEIKGEPVRVETAAAEKELSEFFELIHFIQPDLPSEHLTKDILMEKEQLRKFMGSHCNFTAYLFQVQKCLDPECYYCSQHPVRMPMDDFQKLSFVPLPLMADNDKHSEFIDLYGKGVDERDRPSSKPSSPAEEIDKKRKDLFVSSKVRRVFNCQD